MPIYRVNNTTYNIPDDMSVKFEQRFPNAKIDMYNGEEKYSIPVNEKNNFVKAYPKATFEYQGNDTSSQEQPSTSVQDFQPSQEVKDYALDNIPDMFKSKGNNLFTHPLQTQEDFSGGSSNLIQRISTDENQRFEQAKRAANDPYMRQQELEHVFKPKNQEQINTVRNLIEEQNKRLDKRLSIHSGSGNNAFNALANSTRYNRETSDDRNQKAVLGYAEKLIEQAQNITDEAKKKGNTNFLAGFYRGFRDTPLDVWAMGLANLRDYAVANQVMDKVDKGEKLSPAEDALMQALVTNAATQMYYAGDLGRGYKAGGAIHESLPFVLDMLLGMGTIQAVTKPAAKSLLKYATEKAAKYGLGKATTGLAKGAARTISGLRDVAAHTATFGSQRVAADYLRRGLGDIQVKPNEDGTVSYDRRENIQTGGEALGKSIVSTAAETGSELLGEYFAPMLGWIGGATGANRIGKIIPASVGKAYSSLVNSQGFKQVQELARRAKIADPIGEYGEEVVNNLVSTAIGDMTPEQLVDLDQNIDTFLGVAPMSALFGAAGTAGYLREQYKNYRNMRQFENRMQEEMGEDWSGVREALQDADIETAREMVKDVLSSDMTPQMKKDAITYISSVLQEQTLQNVDKQSMPEDIAQAKRNIFTNLSNTRRQIPLSDEQLNEVISRVESQGKSALEEMGFTPEQQDMIMSYNDAYQDYNNYTFWVQDMAQNARRQAEQQVESLTNATTGTVMRVKAGFSQEPVNILRGNVVFDGNGNVDAEKSDKVIYYLDKDGKVQMSPVTSIRSLIDETPAEEVAAQAGTDAENEVLQSEEAQVNPPIELGTVFTHNGQNYIVGRKTPDGYEIAAVDESGELIPGIGTQEVSEEDLRNAINAGRSETTTEQQEESGNVIQPDKEENDDVNGIDTGATVQENSTVNQASDSEMNGQDMQQEEIPESSDEQIVFIGEGEEAEPDFTKVSPKRGYDYLYNKSGLNTDEANAFVQANIEESQKQLDKVMKSSPKMGTSISSYKRQQKEYQNKVNAAKDKLDYWNAVKSERERIKAEETARRRAEQKAETEKAISEERIRIENEKKKSKEQEKVGINNAAPSIREKWLNSDKIEGAENEIVLADGEKIKGRYILVESGSATPSHDVRNGFAKTEGFPIDENNQSVNDRDYERDKNAQEITRQIAANYDSRALQSPVVVSSDGVVLSGNGRTMAGEIAAEMNTDNAYIEYLKKYPEQFGLTKEQVESMQHPRLVFVPEESMPYTAETFSRFNQQDMKGQSRTEQSVKLGKVVDDNTFKSIARSISRYDSMSDFYSDENAAREAINTLYNAGVINNNQISEMFDGDTISSIGKELLENVLIGKVFESNPDSVRQITEYKSMRQSIMSALSEISENMSLGSGYSLENEISQAISLVYSARKNGVKSGESASAYARQGNLFQIDDGSTVADYTNATVMMLADMLNDGRVTRLKKAISSYNERAKESSQGQMDLFTGTVETKEEILRFVNKLFSDGTEQQQKTGKSRKSQKGGIQQDASSGTVDDGNRGTGESGSRKEGTESRANGETNGTIEEKEVNPDNQQPNSTSGESETTSIQEPNESASKETENKFTAPEINPGENVLDYANRVAKEKEIWDERRKVASNPTEAQKEAGNYRKGHIKIDGFDVTIENPKGSVRSGKDADGNEWSVTMNNDYGYIRGTEGVDGDHIDVFLSDNPERGNVYVIDQIDQKTGEFDESKIMYGFDSMEDAKEAYLSNFEEGWKVGIVSGVTKDEFRKWIESSVRKTKPFSEYKSVNVEEAQNEGNELTKERTEPKFLSESEYIERKTKEDFKNSGIEDRQEWDESDESLDSFNNASDEYPNYISNLSKSGELQRIYDQSSIGEKIKIRESVEAAGYEINELIDTSKEKSTAKEKRERKREKRSKELMEKLGINSEKNNDIVPSGKGNNVRYRFIGEKGAANLDTAEEANTRLDNLAVAREMEKSGKDAKAIKMATGWERGADGKWRYETADFEYYPSGDARKDKLIENRQWYNEYMTLVKKLLDGETLTEKEQARYDEFYEQEQEARKQYESTDKIYLDDYIKDDELFNAYPELKRTKVLFVDKSNGEAGSYLKKDNTITININSEIEARSILAHEIQHAIQRMEGFATGGNYKSVLLFFKENPEVEIKFVVDETYKEAKNRGIDITKEELYKMFTESDDVAQGIENEIIDRNNITESELGEVYNSGVDAGYRAISGEVEARNVQSRLNMTPEERRNTLASETEDVAREDQIFLYDSMSANNMIIDTNQISEDIKREVEKTAKSLNIPAEVITSTDQIKDESVRKAIESGRKIKGWYSLSDRKVYVYLPNTSSIEDARQTILHEGVAHFGLRKLVGDENMDSYLDEVFANVTKEVRERIISTLPRYGWDSRVATEEYLASMAENGVDVTVWQRIKQAFKNLLRKIGIRMEINDNELRYILWRSSQNLESGNVLDMAKDIAMQYEMGVGNYYREVEQTPEHSTVDAWDKIASSTMFSLRESAVDYLTAVDKFQELISKRSGEEIKPFENAYDSMTFLSSKNRVEMDWFDSNIVTPMRKAILALVGKQKGRKWDWEKGELRKLVMYVEAKHGTERNRQMAVEKFIKEFRPESLKFFEKAGISIDRKKYEEELDSIKEKARKKAYEKSFRKIYDNLVKEGTQKEEAEKEAKKRADAIALIAESNASEKFWNDSRGKLMKEYTEKFMLEWNDIKRRISEKKDMSWIEKQKELDKEASRLGADLTQDYSGLSSVFGDENTYPKGWYEESMNFVDEYEKSHEKKDIDGLWKSISDATGYTLNKQYESGLVSKEYVETQKKRFENYIPLRGFQDEIAGDVYNYIGNDFYPGSNPVKSAGGRTSEPGNPFGSILNTGYSTISVGNKNLAKMSFFSLVNNHDTEGLAVAGQAWAVKYDRLLEDEELREVLVMPDLKKDEEIPEWVEAVPKYPDNSGYNTNDGSKSRTSPVTDMSSEDVARLLGKFEEVMKKNSKEGYAKPISKKSKIAYRTLYNERSEHEIPLFILGNKYVITITGNPRVAQAMNGLLNPNVNNKGWSEIGEKVQRFMAGAMTAKNAAFSIGNLSKDSIYANNQVFIKENTSYWLRFTKNQKGGFGDFIPMMIRLKNYRDGKLDMSDKSDVMFKEFMDNGGATGYTFVDTQEKYAKELADKLKELSRKTPGMIDPRKITKAFFDSVEFTGQAAELVNRFAAYRTSREMGRSVNRSIRDAKEITVNFNRKGAGMKSWNDNKSVFNPLNTAAFLSQYGRSYILFWNANMQAKYRFYRNIKEHPIKTTTTLIGNSMLFASILIPFMNNFALPALYEMFGCGSEDDDEDYYNVLTDFERTRNICVRLPHGNWLKIPLSPDMSPWFTMGDCIGGAITGQRELSASDFIKSGIDAISPLSINWSYEGSNIVLNVLPTIFQPGAQIAMNVNFMGNPIRKQPFTMRQGFAPKYTMVYGNTSPTLIELSRLSNRLTGGNDRKTSGSLDWNPADIQNLITGYTGGYGSSFLSAADWIVSTLKGEEQSTTVGKMPLVSRFFISGNKDVKVRRVNSSFYDVIRFTEEFKFDRKSLEDEIQNSLKEGNKEKAMQSRKDLEELLNSDRAKKFIELESIVEAAKDFDRYMKEIPEDENTKGIIYEIKMKGIERLKQK